MHMYQSNRFILVLSCIICWLYTWCCFYVYPLWQREMIIFWDTAGKWSSSDILKENDHLLGYRGKMIKFWDTEGKWSNSGIQRENYHLLGYWGQMIIFWNAEGQWSSSGIQKDNNHILGYRGKMIIFWNTLRKNAMTYIVPAVFCLWVVFNEPVRHGPKQSIFNHY